MAIPIALEPTERAPPSPFMQNRTYSEAAHLHRWNRQLEVLEEGEDVDGGEHIPNDFAKHLTNFITSEEEDIAFGVKVSVRHVSFDSPRLQYSLPNLWTYTLSCFGLVEWEKIIGGKRRRLLDDVSFDIEPRSMTLLLGSPGSGKSTLCKVLADQSLAGTVSGEIRFGGCKPDKATHHHRVAFVPDTDTHVPYNTVRETLVFANGLLNTRHNLENADEKIQTIMKILGLSHREDTLVGSNLLRGISGGEKRRLSIGVELVKNRQLCVLDEATSGLDSTTSLQIFKAIKILSKEVCPVIASLKQPGRDLYDLFDRVLILHEGRLVYDGPKDGLLPHFSDMGFDVRHTVNPADEILRILAENGEEIVEIHDSNQERLNRQLKEKDDDEERQRLASGGDDHEKIYNYSEYSRSSLLQFLYIVRRGFLMLKNYPPAAIGRIIFALIISFMIGTIFFQLGNSQADLNSLSGVLFIIASFSGFQAMAGIPRLYELRPIYYYQRDNRYFKVLPALLGQFVVDLPVCIVESFVFSTICYWVVGLDPAFLSYLYFMLIVMTNEILFLNLTYITSYVFPDFLTANAIAPPLLFAINYFSGFVIIKSRAPEFLQWLFWVSPFRYIIEGLMINQFLSASFMCEDDEFLPPNDDADLFKPYALGGYEGNQICPITNGTLTLISREYETEEAYKWYWLLVIIGMATVALFGSLLAMRIRWRPDPPRDFKRADQIHRDELNNAIALRESALRLTRKLTSSDIAPLQTQKSLNLIESQGEKYVGAGRNRPSRRIDTRIPVYFEWKNIYYTVPVPAGKSPAYYGTKKAKLSAVPCCGPCTNVELELLHDVSGYVGPGMLVVFMGPSGAGKTTLMDVLALRKTAGKRKGTILVNGAPLDPETLSRFGGYVEQQNLHIESETVKEALELSAALRLAYVESDEEQGKKVTWGDCQAHVKWVLEEMELWDLRHALIRELTLEQKKRVTIAVELAANPSLLFLDEPTTSLDGLAALRIMRAIRKIADSGVAVICTVHQPSENVFSLATHLLLISPGGKIAYFGDLGNDSAEVYEHFAEIGYHPRKNQNPADFFLDCCSGVGKAGADKSVEDEPDYRKEQVDAITSFYAESAVCQYHQGVLDRGFCRPQEGKKKSGGLLSCFRRKKSTAETESGKNSVEDEEEKQGGQTDAYGSSDVIPLPTYSSKFSSSIFWQAVFLSNRNVRFWLRHPGTLITVIVRSFFFGLLLAILFMDGITEDQQGAGEAVSIIFFVVMISGSSVMTFIPQLFEERPILYREMASHCYRVSVYLSTFTATSLLITAAATVALVVPVLAITNLFISWFSVPYFGVMIFLLGAVPLVIALTLAGLAPNAEAANGMVAMINIVGSLCAGFLIVKSQLLEPWLAAYWTAYLHYGLEGLLVSQLDGRPFGCPNNEGALPIPVPNPRNATEMRVQYYCSIPDGNAMLEVFEMNTSMLVWDLIILIAMFFGFLCLAWFFMVRMRHIKR